MSKPSGQPRISDLRGTRVLALLPPGREAEGLVTHLIRIGCLPRLEWPIPEKLPDDIDVAIIPVDSDARSAIRVLIANLTDLSPPIIALVGYEDPSTLQLVLELRSAAVIERPVKPFGLLTNLKISRDIWKRRRKALERLAAAEQRQSALSMVDIAKTLLCKVRNMDMSQTHRYLQKTAMDGRIPIEVAAEQVIAEITAEAAATRPLPDMPD
ncbi:ANTAR domain-containing response regulator [Paracoccus shanxieyensis]|uniref:ANTAR domain-containing protein n=1 Tax=Paracoccus shanxieyensis TaxID=2675752 RepID=A0A6L6IZF8_9RHOB|nr:ANTAR domain-containing protein [Paracoccus shanxieyensis]MTH63944.1 ANTAR domain-containing protein [Paracoccus shanxieyensis]MTH87015.1 ANTAR domain-containing protein [Paracoccus shanxieyensis]